LYDCRIVIQILGRRQSQNHAIAGACGIALPIATFDPGRPPYPPTDSINRALTRDSPYIEYNDLPKVENLKRLFADVYRDEPVTVASSAR
jgi:hypothetical protein